MPTADQQINAQPTNRLTPINHPLIVCLQWYYELTIKDRTPLGALSEPLGSGNGATAIGVHLAFCSFSDITSVSIL